MALIIRSQDPLGRLLSLKIIIRLWIFLPKIQTRRSTLRTLAQEHLSWLVWETSRQLWIKISSKTPREFKVLTLAKFIIIRTSNNKLILSVSKNCKTNLLSNMVSTLLTLRMVSTQPKLILLIKDLVRSSNLFKLINKSNGKNSWHRENLEGILEASIQTKLGRLAWFTLNTLEQSIRTLLWTMLLAFKLGISFKVSKTQTKFHKVSKKHHLSS
jgi:hypothetical protein